VCLGAHGEVSRVLKVVSILSRKLKPGRTSLVVRRPAPTLGGQTLLEAMRDGAEKALAQVEEAFDWSGLREARTRTGHVLRSLIRIGGSLRWVLFDAPRGTMERAGLVSRHLLNADEATAKGNADRMIGKLAGIGVDIDDLEQTSYRSSSPASSPTASCRTY